MTIFGWDLSHYDWDRGPVNLAKAKAEGITFATHKIGEGSGYTDARYDDFYAKAKAAGMPLVGAYYVLRPGDEIAQADRFLALLDAKAPGWRSGPFMLQADCESWGESPEPSPVEVRGFCDRLAARSHCVPIVYAPKWVYGDRLVGIRYPLWASSYGANGIDAWRDLYPGDTSSRWAAYSGQVPAVLQYGSRAVIGQVMCDINAFRGTLAQLTDLVTGEDMSFETDQVKVTYPKADVYTGPTALGATVDAARKTLDAVTALGKSLSVAIAALSAKDFVDEVKLGSELAAGIGAYVVAHLPEDSEVTAEALTAGILGAIRQMTPPTS